MNSCSNYLQWFRYIKVQNNDALTLVSFYFVGHRHRAHLGIPASSHWLGTARKYPYGVGKSSVSA